MASLLRIVLVAAVSVATFASPALAQTRRPSAPPSPVSPPPRPPRPPSPPPRVDRGYIVGGAGFNVTPTSFSDVVRPIDFGEPAVVDNRFRMASAPVLDISGAYHVRRAWWAGVEVTHLGRSGDDTVAARIPHPFVFNRLRDVSGEATLGRRETSLHFQAIWTRAVFQKWQGSIIGGPSWIRVSQDLVADVTVTQVYPYDTATFASAVSQRRSGSRLGFNVGGAADYHLTRRAAARLSLSFAHARVPLDVSDSHTVKITAGGLRMGGGVLFRF